MTIFGDTSSATDTGRSSLDQGDRRGLALVRIAVGLIQGLALYGLWRSIDDSGGGDPVLAWPATQPTLFGPLAMIALYVPIVVLAGVGRMRVTTLAIWTGVVTVVLGLLAWHDVTRQVAADLTPPFLTPALFIFAATALFIAHHLVVPADQERRRIASFPAYFDTAWKAGVQLALSIGFTGAFWILMYLGAALFDIIGLKFLGELLQKSWFAIPITTVAFAVAVQLTDVRDGLIRGVRTVALMLLSWLLLVITVLVAGFLAALPFTGLDGLWETGSATSLVLAAAAALIILINTAYQDGQPDNLPPAVLRVAVRVAAVLLTPLIVISIWGLSLRIGQHGLTPDRIIACACALVGVGYAAGYGWAALRTLWKKGDWMRPLEPTNVWTAILTVAVILALFSPLADPARLSVMDQTARLARGAVTPAKFDYAFLRFESGRVGQAALERLIRSDNPEIARRAREAKATENRWDARTEDVDPPRTPIIAAWPADATLPPEFLRPVPKSDDRHGCDVAGGCLATLIDMNGDGEPEILLADSWDVTLFARDDDGGWTSQGNYRPQGCFQDPKNPDPRLAMRAGTLRPVPAWPDLSFGATPAQLADSLRCRREADAAR